MTQNKSEESTRGFALLVVLLIVAVLAAMVSEFLFGVRLHAEMLSNHRNSVKARYIGRSAYNAYKYLVETDQFNPSSGQNLIILSKWTGFGSGLDNVEDGDKAAAILGIGVSSLEPNAEGPLRGQWSIPLPSGLFDLEGVMDGRMVSERGKININALVNRNTSDRAADTVNRRVHSRLFTLFQILEIKEEEALQCVDGLVDWIDGNFGTEPYGAEENHYRSLEPYPYYTRDDYLQSVDEMRLVRGCTNEIVERVKDFLTVYPRKGPNGNGAADGRIDFGKAPKAVCMAVFLAPPDEYGPTVNDHGIADQVCDEIYQAAMNKCNLTITVESGGRTHISAPKLISAKDIKEVIGGRLTGNFDFYDYRKTDAQYYHIVGMGEVKGVTAGVEAIIKKATKGVEVLSWRED